jgi:hypothetical protein
MTRSVSGQRSIENGGARDEQRTSNAGSDVDRHAQDLSFGGTVPLAQDERPGIVPVVESMAHQLVMPRRNQRQCCTHTSGEWCAGCVRV